MNFSLEAPFSGSLAMLLEKKTVEDACNAGIVVVGVAGNSAADGTVPITIQNDSIYNKSVDVRVSFPLKSNTSIDKINIAASTTSKRATTTKAMFSKYFLNKIVVVSFGQEGAFPVEVKTATKLPNDFNTKNLQFYSYQPTTNKFVLLSAINYTIDSSGYIHFTANVAGDIITSDGLLAKK